VDDVQRLDRLRPWLAHAFRRHQTGGMRLEDRDLMGTAGAPVLSGQIILTADTKILFQTPSVEALLRIIEGGSADLTRYIPVRDRLPGPILKLLKRLNGAVNGDSHAPPRMQISTAYGVVTLEGKWLTPTNTNPADVANDPKSCLVAVTIELRENAIALAARILRESGATPAQLKVGIQLALGKTKRAVADMLGTKLTSVADLTRKLYHTFGVHNAAELGAKIWLAGDRA
jgi:DNA-binding CsgD family transcriptional regulator